MNPLRLIPLCSLFVIALASARPADAASVTVTHHGGPRHRTTVVVHSGHPIHRPMHTVVVHRPDVVVRVRPAVFLPVYVWRPVVVVRPAADVVAWQDSETFDKEDDWSEVVFNSDEQGKKLYLEVTRGLVQFDFAEVVFENGDCQVVDFDDKALGVGMYELVDFKNGRKVDHVRVIARAKTKDAKVALLMLK